MFERVEKQFEQIAVRAVTRLMLSTDFCFSVDQRKALEERDSRYAVAKPRGNKGACAFPVPHECNGDKGTQKHHIKPQAYMTRMGLEDVMDVPENGICLCKNAHVGKNGVHSDQPQYLDDYRQGDKESFKKMQKDRIQKLDEHEIYWNDQYDRQMEITALRNTQNAKRKGWQWPFGKKD